MIRQPPRSTRVRSSAASDVYKRQNASIYTVGFCFGGNVSWGAATHDHGLAGAVGFYGKPDADRPAGDGPIWDRCHLIECPVVALFGGDDPGIPAENIS